MYLNWPDCKVASKLQCESLDTEETCEKPYECMRMHKHGNYVNE